MSPLCLDCSQRYPFDHPLFTIAASFSLVSTSSTSPTLHVAKSIPLR